MKKSILYLLLMVSATIASCQKDADITDSPLSGQSLSVSLPTDDASTRVEYSDNESGVTLSWEEGDKFSIYTADGNYVDDFLYLETNSDGNSAFISATASTALISGTNYTAIYPSIDSPLTLDAHRAELAARVANQTQSGNSSSDHLNDALRMESEFTYQGISDNTTVAFTHKMSAVRIAFAYDGSIPTKAIFYDGDNASYTLNFEDVTETSTYTSYFVIEPNSSTSSRDLRFEIYGDDADVASSDFSMSSSTTFVAGIQYRLTLALSDITKYIYTTADLIAFRTFVNAGNATANAVLMDDINLSGETWTPIGTSSSIYYSGTFDGGGHTISNLTINSSSYYQGLFGYVKGGAISNLILDNPQVSGTQYVGAVCGYMDSYGSISECGVTNGVVSGSGNIYYSYVGGVVGSSSSSSVSSCYNTGEVSGSECYVGGVVGRASSSSVTSCYNTGEVSGEDYYVGGVAGSAPSSSVTSCYNTGAVSGSKYVGGVTGPASSVIDCYNTGKVSGSGDYVGGVAGSASSVTSCYNMGEVSGSGDNVGGVVGSVSSSVIDCYNRGVVLGEGDYVGGVVGYVSSSSSITDCYNTGAVSGSSGVGGVVGYIYYSSSSVTSCYNTGEVSGSSGVGGVVGNSSSSSVTSCYNTGEVSGSSYNSGVGGVVGCASSSVTSCYNTGEVSGSKYVGGVVGQTSKATSCYNTGKVSGSSGDYVGGVAGYSSSAIDWITCTSIIYCYYLPSSGTTYTNSYGTSSSTLVTTMTSSSFPETLNTAAGDTYFEYDSNNINNGYPILISIDYTATTESD